MTPYPHIDSVYKRDQKGKFILGEYSCPEFEYLKDNLWVWTEKIDGTNMRIMYSVELVNRSHFAPYDGYEHSVPSVKFGGKTDNAQLPSKLVNWLNEHLCSNGGKTDIGLDLAFTVPTFQRLFGDEGNVCLYGEGYGAGIQKGGGLYSPEQKFILFDVKVGNIWLKREDIEDVANKLNLDVVPLYPVNYTLADMVNVVALRNPQMYSQVGLENTGNIHVPIEGFVGKPLISLLDRRGRRIITKIKYKDFA